MATGTIHNTCRVLKSNNCRITCDYAAHQAREKYKSHVFGCDMTTSIYTTCDIVAHSNGTVVRVVDYIKAHELDKTGMGFGNQVVIQHNDGYLTIYNHMAYGTVKVKVGQPVSKGQVIGTMGNTGSSQGAHLDFSLIHMIRGTFDDSVNLVLDLDKKFIAFDPESFLESDLPSITTTPTTSTEIVHQEYTGSDYYRVKNTWVGGTQKGAYHSYTSAENQAKKFTGYKVFDKDGKQLYPTIGNTDDYKSTDGKYFRVRTSWGAITTQKGAYKSFATAVTQAKKYAGYSVYDNEGIEVY